MGPLRVLRRWMLVYPEMVHKRLVRPIWGVYLRRGVLSWWGMQFSGGERSEYPLGKLFKDFLDPRINTSVFWLMTNLLTFPLALRVNCLASWPGKVRGGAEVRVKPGSPSVTGIPVPKFTADPPSRPEATGIEPARLVGFRLDLRRSRPVFRHFFSLRDPPGAPVHQSTGQPVSLLGLTLWFMLRERKDTIRDLCLE